MRKGIIIIIIFLISDLISGQSAYDCLLKAKALIRTGKPEQAIEILSAALVGQSDSRLFIERGDAALITGDNSGAISDYNSANKITDYSGEYGLSRVYALKGDAATSLYHLEMNQKSTFKKSEKEIMRDPAFSRIENKPEWRQFWKKEWYSVIEKGISEIEYDLSVRANSEAISMQSGLERNYPGNEAVKYSGALIKIAQGKNGEAVKLLSDLLTSDPENEKYLRELAKAQTGGLNPSGASDTYSKLISLEIPDAEFLILRAECYRKTGESDKAMNDIRKYLSIYPDNKPALSLAGKVESASGNNLEALEYFSENLKLHPDDADCYIDRANSYFLSKSWNWAIKDYSMALDLAPENPEIWLNKGIALMNSGKTDDACHDFRSSLTLGNKRAADYISRYCIK